MLRDQKRRYVFPPFATDRDCEAQVYDILIAYGARLPSDAWPVKSWNPNWWYNDLGGYGFGRIWSLAPVKVKPVRPVKPPPVSGPAHCYPISIDDACRYEYPNAPCGARKYDSGP